MAEVCTSCGADRGLLVRGGRGRADDCPECAMAEMLALREWIEANADAAQDAFARVAAEVDARKRVGKHDIVPEYEAMPRASSAAFRCEPCVHLAGHFTLSGMGWAVSVSGAALRDMRSAVDEALAAAEAQHG